MADLKKNGGNLEYTHGYLNIKCSRHKSQILKNNDSAREIEQTKRHEIKIDKGFSM